MRIVAATLSITLAALAAGYTAPAAAQTGYGGYGMADPAATYCAQIGGRNVTRYDRNGGAAGWCRLRDGREVDAWALYRQRGAARADDRRSATGNAAASYCRGLGGQYYVAGDAYNPRTGWCRLRDGRIADAQRLYQERRDGYRGGDQERQDYGDRDDDRDDGRGYPQPYGAAPYGNGYDQRYGNGYSQRYGNGYSQRYGGGDSQPYGNGYNQPYGSAPYNNGYNQPYGTTPYGYAKPDPYAQRNGSGRYDDQRGYDDRYGSDDGADLDDYRGDGGYDER